MARILALLTVLGFGFALADRVRAEPAAPLPATSLDTRPLPERARAVLETHCPECREQRPLDLDALAGDPRLVVPRRPDASRIYQHLLRAAGASPAEIETVRDWIEGLPARDADCRGRKFLTNRDVGALIVAWGTHKGEAELAGTRFLSLAHLWNSCVSLDRLKEYRDAVAILLAAVARHREPLDVETLGDESAILVVRLNELALLPAQWVRLMAPAPRVASADAVPADWLAARILSRPKDESGNVDPAFDVQFDASGQRAVEGLASLWTRDVDLVRAAAERGVSHRTLAEALGKVGGDFLLPARRLQHGALSRAAWENLSLALDGEAKPGSAVKDAPAADSEIDVLLWTDKPVYRPRDLVTINVSVSKACHLTLIDVDRSGHAIVLFPNELEPDNLVAPGVTVGIPGRDADYQLRFDRSGEEEIVAICQRKSRRAEGIAYDYEKQRFAILGDWRTFLRTAQEHEKEIRANETGDGSRRRRRGRTPAASGLPAIDPDGPAAEGRAAIYVTIDPGGGAKP